MPNSSVFIDLTIRAIYGPKCQHAKKNLKKEFECTYDKSALYILFSTFLRFFYASISQTVNKCKYLSLGWFVTYLLLIEDQPNILVL